jgi:hypothetical protein
MAAKHRKTNLSWAPDESDRQLQKICAVSGKRMYASERDANATASHRMNDKESRPSQLRTYKCLYCGAWHLTSKME